LIQPVDENAERQGVHKDLVPLREDLNQYLAEVASK
jgi:hypothetical protein